MFKKKEKVLKHPLQALSESLGVPIEECEVFIPMPDFPGVGELVRFLGTLEYKSPGAGTLNIPVFLRAVPSLTLPLSHTVNMAFRELNDTSSSK